MNNIHGTFYWGGKKTYLFNLFIKLKLQSRQIGIHQCLLREHREIRNFHFASFTSIGFWKHQQLYTFQDNAFQEKKDNSKDFRYWNHGRAHFNDFVQALICNHPDVGLLVIAAQQEHFHSDTQKFLELWGSPGARAVVHERDRIRVGLKIRISLIVRMFYVTGIWLGLVHRKNSSNKYTLPEKIILIA